jgi:hypothetical protein
VEIEQELADPEPNPNKNLAALMAQIQKIMPLLPKDYIARANSANAALYNMYQNQLLSMYITQMRNQPQYAYNIVIGATQYLHPQYLNMLRAEYAKLAQKSN